MVKGLRYIVEEINESVKLAVMSLSNYEGFKLYDLATSAVKNKTIESYPVVYDLNGEGKYVGVEDIAPFISYHKCNRMQSSIIPNTGYGNSIGKTKVTYEMTLYVFLDRKATQAEGDEFIILLEHFFPANVKAPQSSFESCRATMGSIILNTSQVFASEYKNVNYFVRPEQILMAISYTLEGTLRKDCFNF